MTLHAQWLTGFTDGEGCFHVAINKNAKAKFKAQILPEFTIVQHESDIQILHKCKKYWKCGVVRRNNKDRYSYRVRSISHLSNIILPFFEKHKLKTKKNIDFLKFRDVVHCMLQKQHCTAEGFQALSKTINSMRKYTKKMDNKTATLKKVDNKITVK